MSDDPYSRLHGPATPNGFCPLCLTPKSKKQGQTVGTYVVYECGTSAQATAHHKDGRGYHRKPGQHINIGDDCFRNVVYAREFFHAYPRTEEGPIR